MHFLKLCFLILTFCIIINAYIICHLCTIGILFERFVMNLILKFKNMTTGKINVSVKTSFP
jgi:hypothetical protein